MESQFIYNKYKIIKEIIQVNKYIDINNYIDMKIQLSSLLTEIPELTD